MFNRKIIKLFKSWKDKKNRKPLVVRGARQVGKTSAILMFAERFFKNIISINLDKSEHSSLFREDLSLDSFKKIVQINLGKNIVPGETLIFIDEIQNSSALLKLLRFFYEEEPALHVMCAGSLLEAVLQKEGLSLPVGRVEYAYLYPLDYFEYLEARNEDALLRFLRDEVTSTTTIPQAIHDHAMKLFYEYTMVGGMPEAVKIFTETNNFNELNSVYSSLLTGYREDVYKYSSQANAKYLLHAIEKAPLYAGSAIAYEKFGGGNYGSREMKRALDALEQVMLLSQVRATQSTDLPLVEQQKRAKKFLFLDVGLVNYASGILAQYTHLGDLNSFYRGRIAEQIVGQSLIACSHSEPIRLLYWAKEKPYAAAEIDYVVNRAGIITGIEVKSGAAGTIRSLFSFSEAVRNSIAMRIYAGTLQKERPRVGDKEINLVSVPFYLLPRITSLQ